MQQVAVSSFLPPCKLQAGSLAWLTLTLLAFVPLAGCRSGGEQYARVIKPGEREMVGSHQAGQETFRPLVEEAVVKLFSRHDPALHVPVGYQPQPAHPPRQTVCFVGVANRSAEEIGDFKDQIYQAIDSKIHESASFAPLSRQYVDAGLAELHLRPDDLFLPDHMRAFCAVMERQGAPIQYLLFATITSGTTRENKEYQRDYQLVLELVDIRTGVADKQSAELSKAYHKTKFSRWKSMGGLFQ